MSRLYIVTDKETQKQHLVEADSQAQSVGVVVGDRFDSKAASALDAAKLMQAGVSVLTAPKRTPKEVNVPEVKPVLSVVQPQTVAAIATPETEAAKATPAVAAQTSNPLSKENANVVMAAVAAGTTAQ